MKIKLINVQYMPKKLDPGILYVSKEFGTAAHLCACGCGTKIRTPLGPTAWSLKLINSEPTLWPSVGNWQQACKSHYLIKQGEIIWCPEWTPEQIIAGRHNENTRRHTHYASLGTQQIGFFQRLWGWVKNTFKN